MEFIIIVWPAWACLSMRIMLCWSQLFLLDFAGMTVSFGRELAPLRHFVGLSSYLFILGVVCLCNCTSTPHIFSSLLSLRSYTLIHKHHEEIINSRNNSSAFLGHFKPVRSKATSCSAPSALGHQYRRTATTWRSLGISSAQGAQEPSAAPIYCVRRFGSSNLDLDYWVGPVLQASQDYLPGSNNGQGTKARMLSSTTLPCSRISSNELRKGLYLDERSGFDGTVAPLTALAPTPSSTDSCCEYNYGHVCNGTRNPTESRAGLSWWDA